MTNLNNTDNNEQRSEKSPKGGFNGLPPLGGRGADILNIILAQKYRYYKHYVITHHLCNTS